MSSCSHFQRTLTTKAVEDQEALQARTLIGDFTQFLQDGVDDFLADGVMTTCIIIRGVFLAGNQLFRVKELRIGSSTDLI